MSTYFDEESGSYKNYENEVISLLKSIAGETEAEPNTTEPEVEEEPEEDPDFPDPEIATGEDGPTE